MRTRRTRAHDTVIHVKVPDNRTTRPVKSLSNGLYLSCWINGKRADTISDTGSEKLQVTPKICLR